MTETEKKYFEAKNDLIKAFKSVNELEPFQKEQLAKELFGVNAAITICNIMRQHFVAKRKVYGN